jgi:hypothetical protein
MDPRRSPGKAERGERYGVAVQRRAVAACVVWCDLCCVVRCVLAGRCSPHWASDAGSDRGRWMHLLLRHRDQ